MTTYEHIRPVERTVIGTLLAFGDDPEAGRRMVDGLRGVVDDVDFSSEAARQTYGRIVALTREGRPAGVMGVFSTRTDRDQIPDLAGLSALSTMTNVDGLKGLAARVREEGRKRRFALLAAEAADRVGEGEATPADYAQRLATLAEPPIAEQTRGMSELMPEAYELARMLIHPDEYQHRVIPAPWKALRRLLPVGGLWLGHHTIVGAATSMGKSAFAVNILDGALKAGFASIAWTGEMGAEEYLLRLAALRAGVDLGSAHPADRGRAHDAIVRAFDELWEEYQSGRLKLTILDKPAIRPSELAAQVREMVARDGPGLVIADYVQLMTPEESQGSREQDVSSIGKDLLALARETGCHVMGLSQLNENPATRPGHKPMLGDLRESKALGHHANGVFLLHRPAYWKAKELAIEEGQLETHAIYDPTDDAFDPEAALILVPKMRMGKVGATRARWLGHCGRFEDY